MRAKSFNSPPYTFQAFPHRISTDVSDFFFKELC